MRCFRRAKAVRLAAHVVPAHEALVRTREERNAARALSSPTQFPTAAAARAYVERPFAFPYESRFSDGTFGVLYSADSLATAFREVAYHLGLFFGDCGAPSMTVRRMLLALRIAGSVEDVRRQTADVPAKLYDPVDYAVAQRFGARLRSEGTAMGIHYDSVRRPDGGHCFAAFTPALVRAVHITGETVLAWDGTRFSEGLVIEPL